MNEDLTQDINKTAIGVVDDGGKTQMAMAPQSNATQFAANVECQVCHTPNPPSETYCIDCGFLLTSSPVAVEGMPQVASVGKLVAPDGTREFPLKPGENSVGRENADVLLANNTVSRHHAKVIVGNGEAFVEDAGSTNGTFVDGGKIAPGERTELKDGCEVVFGSMTLKYECEARSVECGMGSAEAEATAHDSLALGGEGKGEGETPESSTEPSQEPNCDEARNELDQASAVTGFDLSEAESNPQSDIPDPQLVEPVKVAVAKLASADGACGFDLFDGVNTIGRRAGDNDIVVPDPYCSGLHAEMLVADGKFTLTDLGSTNGTLVNDVKLDANAPREVYVGDQLTLGRTMFRIEVVS